MNTEMVWVGRFELPNACVSDMCVDQLHHTQIDKGKRNSNEGTYRIIMTAFQQSLSFYGILVFHIHRCHSVTYDSLTTIRTFTQPFTWIRNGRARENRTLIVWFVARYSIHWTIAQKIWIYKTACVSQVKPYHTLALGSLTHYIDVATMLCGELNHARRQNRTVFSQCHSIQVEK